jgi:hypothetical protein
MITRLERLNHVRSVAVNKQKLSSALEILQSQEGFSLLDPVFIAVGLEESQIDQVIEMYAQDPLPVRMKESSLLLTQDIKRLNRGYTEQHAVEFVQWVRNTDSDLSISQLVDQHAKFTLDCKFRSMAHRFDRTHEYFIGWYEKWSLAKLADWVDRLYGNVIITTLTEELHKFKFNFKAKKMDLADPNSRAQEDATFQSLNDILLKYTGPEHHTQKVQTAYVKILKDKI